MLIPTSELLLSKSHQPEISYLAPSRSGPVYFDKDMLQASMRLTRGDGEQTQPPVTFKDYFQGITDVISEHGYRPLLDAAMTQLAKDVYLSDIDKILIYAEKDGSDYHPARIEVVIGDTRAPFAINVALTARGKARVAREFQTLQYLNKKYQLSFLPKAYFEAESFYESRHRGKARGSMLMFLADWFQGYHEFHLSMGRQKSCQKLIVWDTDNGPYYLSRPEAWQLYSQAAEILTGYYDINTFEQIFPWHHAAGDFVVKKENNSVDVRLVAARQYASMLVHSSGISRRDALLFFFLNLSLRMRIDRLDGIGTVVWADDDCVDATLEGFIEGLREKQRKGAVEPGFVDSFLQDCSLLDKEELSLMFRAIVDACNQAAPDMPIIRQHLDRHISKVHIAFQGLNE